MNETGSNCTALEENKSVLRGSVYLLSGLVLVALVTLRRVAAPQTAGAPTFAAALGRNVGVSAVAQPAAFVVHSYQGRSRCLDYTAGKTGSPVFINDCQVANPVVVEELPDGKHTVVLHAGNLVIGIPYGVVRTQGGTPTPVAAEIPLQLLKLGTTTLSGNHFFELDGDSIK